MIDFNAADPQHNPGKPNGRDYWEEIDEAEQAHARGEEPPKPEVPKLHLIDAADLEGIVPPKREFIVEGMLAARTVALLAGRGSIGKSLLSLQLGECVRRGIPFLGRQTTPTTTIIFSCEDDQDEMHRRLFRMRQSLGSAIDTPGRILLAPRLGEPNSLISFDTRTGLAQPTEAFMALEAAVIEHGARLIVIDTSAQTFPGNENDRAQATAFVNMLARLALKNAGCVLLLAHPPKNGAEWSGSTGWDGAVRARLFLDAKDDEGTRRYFLKISKANYAPESEEEVVRDSESGLMFQADDVPPSLAEKIDQYANAAFDRSAFLTALDAMTAQGRALSHNNRAGNYAPKVILAAGLGAGCSLQQLERAMNDLFKEGRIIANAIIGRKNNRMPLKGLARAGAPEAPQNESQDDAFVDLNDAVRMQ